MAKTRSRSKGKDKTYKIELTSISALLWFVFVFFLLIWVFVLGILVGRGFFPGTMTTISDLKSQIKKLQEMVTLNEPYDSRPPKETEQDPKLAFYEKLASKKDEVKNNWTTETEAETPKEDELPLQSQAVQETVEEVKALNGLPEQNKPELPVSTGTYTVQIASIEDGERAEKLIEDLIDQGYDAYYYKTDVNGKTYYRIRCGRFTTKGDALAYAQKIEEEAGLKGFVSRIE